ncbi:hypothetical protein GMES_1735 [Paraglaciecola mesophila KMM 241]|uniref:Uncharacterized protein n=1 Tax=Paraglaciecola mesophila KMM 241 TaxID=1128912 RepID=K6YJ66_9ALTE|nr:hypothetical protein GMES_1735 [Paraglaciecola mesophila KMM 241]
MRHEKGLTTIYPSGKVRSTRKRARNKRSKTYDQSQKNRKLKL